LLSDKHINTVDEFKAAVEAGKTLQSGVRLEDKFVSLAARSGMKPRQLHEAFPAEFDAKGDLRSRRMPLGRAAKHFFDVGAKDLHGHVIQPGQLRMFTLQIYPSILTFRSQFWLLLF